MFKTIKQLESEGFHITDIDNLQYCKSLKENVVIMGQEGSEQNIYLDDYSIKEKIKYCSSNGYNISSEKELIEEFLPGNTHELLSQLSAEDLTDINQRIAECIFEEEYLDEIDDNFELDIMNIESKERVGKIHIGNKRFNFIYSLNKSEEIFEDNIIDLFKEFIEERDFLKPVYKPDLEILEKGFVLKLESIEKVIINDNNLNFVECYINIGKINFMDKKMNIIGSFYIDRESKKFITRTRIIK